MALALLSFIAVFLLMSSIGILVFHRRNILKRLSQIGAKTADATLLQSIAPSPRTRIEQIVKPFQEVVPRSLEDVSTLQKRLIRAGYREPGYVNIFYGAKVLVPAILCILITVTQVYAYAPLFLYALAAGLGFMAPDFWLSNRISARKLKLRLGLPEALDLIVICVEAGLSMDKATMRTAEELRISQPAIADELNLVYLEQRAGRPRGEAWRNLGDRTDVDTIRSLASILIQADKFGTSIGKMLRAHSETLRTRRRQDAEEQAAKTTVKLVFPLVLFIFPSLFVVTLGPSMIIMFEGFSKYLS
ncbi:MAG: type II secretion system F family protein [Bryobacteraceae bacterium]|jgi:tight adherence protein C